MWQLGPTTQETLLALGTQVVGSISDMETAELLAHRFCNLDPYLVKRWENVWMQGVERAYIIEQKPVYFPMDEQKFLAARDFMNRPPFWFYVRPRHEDRLLSVCMRSYMGKPWPNEHPAALAYIRHQLGLRIGAAWEPPAALPNLPPTDDEPLGTMDGGSSNERSTNEDQIDPDYWATVASD